MADNDAVNLVLEQVDGSVHILVALLAVQRGARDNHIGLSLLDQLLY